MVHEKAYKIMRKNAKGRWAKVFAYVVNKLNQMHDDGLLEGGIYFLNQEGEKAIEGFEPTEEEVFAVMDFMNEKGIINVAVDTPAVPSKEYN